MNIGTSGTGSAGNENPGSKVDPICKKNIDDQ